MFLLSESEILLFLNFTRRFPLPDIDRRARFFYAIRESYLIPRRRLFMRSLSVLLCGYGWFAGIPEGETNNAELIARALDGETLV